MAVCRYRCSPSGDDAEVGFVAVRADLDVPTTYPAPALAEADEAARRGLHRPPGAVTDHADRALERALVHYMEALVLTGHEGRVFSERVG